MYPCIHPLFQTSIYISMHQSMHPCTYVCHNVLVHTFTHVSVHQWIQSLVWQYLHAYVIYSVYDLLRDVHIEQNDMAVCVLISVPLQQWEPRDQSVCIQAQFCAQAGSEENQRRRHEENDQHKHNIHRRVSTQAAQLTLITIMCQGGECWQSWFFMLCSPWCSWSIQMLFFFHVTWFPIYYLHLEIIS